MTNTRWWQGALRPFDWDAAFRLPPEPPAIRIEEYRSAERYLVRAELPGVDADRDIDIRYQDGVLYLRVCHEPGSEAPTRSEFRYGVCARSIPLPEGAAVDRMTVTYLRGILEIDVPLTGQG